MSDFSDAKTHLQNSIAGNKAFLALQDVQATLDATIALLQAINVALRQWARGTLSLATVLATTEVEVNAALSDPASKDLRDSSAAFAGHIAELKALILKIAIQARS